MTRRALVTGANGFVGAAIMRAAASFGIEATGVVRSPGAQGCLPSDYSPHSIARLMDELRSDIVVHAAGSASVAASMKDPARDFAASVALTQCVLEGIRLSVSRPRLLFLSSAAVYGNPTRLPVAEDAPLAPISAYGHHKAMCEQMLREYAECFGVSGTALRIFSVFGEEQRKLLVWELFRRYREAGDVELMGTGDEVRDYLHVDDLAALVWRCTGIAAEAMPALNVASGSSVRVLDLALRIGAAIGSDKRIVCRGQRNPGDPAVWRADVSRLRSFLGDPGPFLLDERLRQVAAAWMR